ncbi:cytochrome P450 [Amycolatopsis sp. NPDC049868]|uniref:cytochrome P450 n=1 Tax=Amycolatopsis sp. NPDC049868 TaxID=3363934 RepID=UPI0037B2F472
MRKIVMSAFNYHAISAIRPAVERIVGELLDEVAGRSEVDLFADFAAPLPTLVLAEYLGFPLKDALAIHHHCDVYTSELKPNSDYLESGKRLTAACLWLRDYTLRLTRHKLAEPDDRLISQLAKHLDEEELASLVFELLIGGQSTTTQLIVRGVRLLLTHGDQLTRLRANPTLLPKAVDECLRHDPPLPVSLVRMAKEPIDIDGVTIHAGDTLVCSLADINHDDAQFSAPDQFNIDRSDNQHLAFGHGVHRCVGANLARLQAEIAISALLKRYDHIELAVPDADLNWKETTLLAKLTTLPLRVEERRTYES